MRGQPELVDNKGRYGHAEALRWLGEHRGGPLAVATGYVRLGGLVALATLPGDADRPVRLLLGALPDPGLGALPVGPSERGLAGKSFNEILRKIREERDFDAFPASRRTETLDLVEGFVRSDRVEVRRYTDRFLHGKTYVYGDRDGDGAVLITSANLTSGGLEHNLELGAVSYQPNLVGMTHDWFDELWGESEQFKDRLLELLYPPMVEFTPQEVFQRALLELYGAQIEKEEADVTVGPIPLTRFMEDGYRRARRIIEEYGGVIYADGVGTGKTTIGLKFVTEYAREKGLYTLVIAPAQLRDSLWAPKLRAANLPHEVLSYQELAQDQQLGGTQRRLMLDKDLYRLILIDEAHAFRNADNTWYAALDRLLGGARKDLVLLTATPVNNSLWDLHNLILLFARHDAAFLNKALAIPSLRSLFVEAGAHDPDEIREEVLFPVVDALAVRRDRRFIQEHYKGETFADGTPVKFPNPTLEEVRYDLDKAFPGLFVEVVDTIGALTMARYVPARYALPGHDAEMPGQLAREEALAGLMQSLLLKRFESSTFAARRTIERMVRAHEVLVEAWERHGKLPSLASLRDLVREVQDDDPLPDLVETALEDDQDSADASHFDPQFVEDVKADLARLQVIESRINSISEDPKLDALVEILTDRTDAQKVIVFCSFADTAEYLKEQLDLNPSRFGGRAYTVVVGTKTDPEERIRQLQRFAPKTVTGIPSFVPLEGEVDLLVSTDVLSEGQNLQQAQAVISFDLPWNPQRVVQRNGRIIRLASEHDEVFLYTMLPKDGDLNAALKLEARVRGKIAAANATFGMESQVLGDVEAEQKAFADAMEGSEGEALRDLEEFFRRVEDGDKTLLDEGQGAGSGSFVGEFYRLMLGRLFREGEFDRLRKLPWGIGSVFEKPGLPPERAGVFFACRSSAGERFWRYVTFGGEIFREDLAMLRLIDPQDRPRADLPSIDQMEEAWTRAAADICERYALRLDPKQREAQLAASQRWALDVLRSPDLPDDPAFDRADQALGVGRNQLVRRALSDTRKRASEGRSGLRDSATAIVDVVDRFGLRPEERSDDAPRPLTKDGLGVVCYQIVLAGKPGQ